MTQNNRVKQWRIKNPKKAKKISQDYYKRKREEIRKKNRIYALKKTTSGRTELLLRQVLGSKYNQIVARALKGKFEYTTSELNRLRASLCKNWTK